jgi:hypothetical protein
MKQIFHPYWLWEDYKYGLYNMEKQSEKEMMHIAVKCKNLLCAKKQFELTALQVISKWKISAEVNLSNKARNRQAWIGQASCCYFLKAPEHITKLGWRLMDSTQQKEANRIADRIINIWEVNYKRQKNTLIKTFL